MFLPFSLFIFLFGLIIGSFLNCLIWRLHKNEGLMSRSYCPQCRHQLAWYDNIPLVSYILLGGTCRYCGQAISWQYPAVELATGALFVAAFLYNFELRIFNFESIFNYLIFNNSIKIHNSKFIIQLLRDWFLISVMIIVFIYDLRWYLILDSVTLPACLVIFVLNILLGDSWHNLLISGIIGGSFFLLQFLVSRGKWIGGGDIRLGLLMGLALGWPNLLFALFSAYIIGSAVGLILIMVGKKQWGSRVPLGVFLSTATIIALFFGEKIINWYLTTINL